MHQLIYIFYRIPHRHEKLLASGTEDGEICVWNMDSYDLEFTVKGSGGKVTATTFDSECKNIIACTNDKTISVFDAKTSTRIYSTLLDNEPTALSWSGSILLVGDDRGNINLWDSQEATFISKTLCHDGQYNRNK